MPYFLFVIAEITGKAAAETSKTVSLDGGGVKSILKLIGLIILCILIILASYFTTKFVGKRQIQGGSRSNFKSIDVFRITPNKYLQIVEVGNRYFCIAVTKESVTLISELSGEDLKVLPDEIKPKSFKEQMSELMHRKSNTDTGKSDLGDIARLSFKQENEEASGTDLSEDALTKENREDIN